MKRRKSVKQKFTSALKSKKQRKLPVWKQIQLLWTAPIAKFWNIQVSKIFLNKLMVWSLWCIKLHKGVWNSQFSDPIGPWKIFIKLLHS